jgi:hypothetical protein
MGGKWVLPLGLVTFWEEALALIPVLGVELTVLVVLGGVVAADGGMVAVLFCRDCLDTVLTSKGIIRVRAERRTKKILPHASILCQAFGSTC